MDIKLIRSALDIDPAAWAALAPRPRGTRAWFETCEAYYESINHFYLTAWDDGQLRAVLPLYDSWAPQYYNATMSCPGITQRLLQQQSFLCIGSPSGYETEMIGDNRYTVPLLSEAVTFASSKGVDFLAANFCRTPLPGWEEYRAGSVFRAHVLRLTGDSYDDFLKKFKSRRRRGFNHEMRRSAPIFRVPMLGNEARFNALRTISCERQGGQNYVKDSFFTHLARTHGDNLILTATGTESDWTGANAIIATEQEFCGMGIGVRNRDESYFNLMVHEPMQRAYATGRREIDLGPSCDKAKLLRGTDPVPLTAYLCPVSKRCKITMNGVRPLAKFSTRLIPRIRRKLAAIKNR